ncbi:MAG: VCBS repeat-containing protein, partial [Myxococcota bacterium]|nr:VCBS repeat-containing protein [Myxococcota bacterium]
RRSFCMFSKHKILLLLLSSALIFSLSCHFTDDKKPEDPDALIGEGEGEGEGEYQLIYNHSENLNLIVAFADFNCDDRKDIVLAQSVWKEEAKGSLKFIRALENGSFVDASATLVNASSELGVYNPHAVIADFNGDGHDDLALFDAGAGYRALDDSYLGEPPRLFLSDCETASLNESTSLADAVFNLRTSWGNTTCNGKPYIDSWGCDVFELGDNLMTELTGKELHIKSVSSADIDNDGDVDLLVESGGGFLTWQPASGHFLFFLNDGSGTFTADDGRIDLSVKRNGQNGTWRHMATHPIDIDADGDMDFVQGKLGNAASSYNFDHDILFNKIHYNDGTGNFPKEDVLELANPDFLAGDLAQATVGQSIATGDINDDGYIDVVIVHSRGGNADNLDGENNPSGTGRFVQIFVGDSSGSFSDQSATYFSDQAPWMRAQITDQIHPNPEVNQWYDTNNCSTNRVQLQDVNGDGMLDILTGGFHGTMRFDYCPMAYLSNAAGAYEPFLPNIFNQQSFYLNGSGLYWVDFDADGDMDVLHANQWGSLGRGLYLFAGPF